MRFHLRGGGVARRAAFRLERERHDGVAGNLVIGDRIDHPGIEAAVGAARRGEFRRTVCKTLIVADTRNAGDFGDNGRIERQRAVLDAVPFGIDFLGKGFRAELMDQDLDACLVDVVAAAELIVGAQDRLDVAQHIALRQERLDGLGKERRAAEAAADHDFESQFAGVVAMQLQREVVDAQRSAIVARTCQPRS